MAQKKKEMIEINEQTTTKVKYPKSYNAIVAINMA
jgi:hypothetical protein